MTAKSIGNRVLPYFSSLGGEGVDMSGTSRGGFPL